MNEVWKFPLGMSVSWRIDCPIGAQPLFIGEQDGIGPCVWMLVDPAAPSEPRDIAMCGTGQPVPHGTYIGSIQMRTASGKYVWHYFDQGVPIGARVRHEPSEE